MANRPVRFSRVNHPTFGLLTYEKEMPPKTKKVKDGEKDETLATDGDFVIPQELSSLSDEELDALRSEAVGNFDALFNGGQGLTAESISALEALTEGIEGVQGELSARRQLAAERESAAQELAGRVHKEERTETIVTEEGDDEDENPAPASGQQAPAAEPVAAVVASSQPARREVRVNMSALARRGSVPALAAQTSAPSTVSEVMFSTGEGSGFSAGEGINWDQVGQVVDRRLAGFNPGQYAQAQNMGKQLSQQFGVAMIRKPFKEGFTVESNDVMHVEEVMRRATDETLLDGGSLVAAGGWCAPSEILYDLLELESRDGLYSLPEINIARGGIQWTTGPDWTDIYANTGFAYTEAQDIAGTYAVDGTPLHNGTGGAGNKPCYTVPCTTFVEQRLSVAGLCINAGLLQSRGYPEILARVVRGALIAHEHKMSARKISAVVAGSTAVTMTQNTVGTTAPLLTAIEMQTEHYRYLRRMARSTTLEAVFPFWVRGAIRSDLALRTGVEMLDVTDNQINEWFRSRGIAPQFVYDWQPLTGGAAGMIQWPTSVQFLLYAAGTWVAGGSDIITIDTLYDSQLLGQNNFTALFTEEGWLVAKRGFDSRVITVPINSNGGTGGAIALGPDGTPSVTDQTGPTAGTLAGSAITANSYTLTVTGASDTGGAGLAPTPYRYSSDNGATWSAWQAGATYNVTGKTASTPYVNVHQVRDRNGNQTIGTPVTVTTTA